MSEQPQHEDSMVVITQEVANGLIAELKAIRGEVADMRARFDQTRNDPQLQFAPAGFQLDSGYHLQPHYLNPQRYYYQAQPQIIPGPGSSSFPSHGQQGYYYGNNYKQPPGQIVSVQADGSRFNIANVHRSAFRHYVHINHRCNTSQLVVFNNQPSEALIHGKGNTFLVRLPPSTEQNVKGNGAEFQRAVYYKWMEENSASFKDFCERFHANVVPQLFRSDERYMCFPGFHFKYTGKVVTIERGNSFKIGDKTIIYIISIF